MRLKITADFILSTLCGWPCVLLILESLLLVSLFFFFFLRVRGGSGVGHGAVTSYNGNIILCCMTLRLKYLVGTTYYPAFHIYVNCTLGQVFLQVPEFFPVSIIPPITNAAYSFIRLLSVLYRLKIDISK